MPIIIGMIEGAIAEDLSAIEATFSTEDGQSLACQFQPNLLYSIVGRLAQLVALVRSQTLNRGDHFEIRGEPVVDAAVRAPIGGGKGTVILKLKIDNDLFYDFSVPLEIASKIREEMQAAEESAGQQSKQTRQ
jgi:hypothetical protein